MYNLICIGVLSDKAFEAECKQHSKNPQVMEMKIWLTKAKWQQKPSLLNS